MSLTDARKAELRYQALKVTLLGPYFTEADFVPLTMEELDYIGGWWDTVAGLSSRSLMEKEIEHLVDVLGEKHDD